MESTQRNILEWREIETDRKMAHSMGYCLEVYYQKIVESKLEE